jgi:hypothetical protein
MRGTREVKIKSAGVDLILNIAGERCTIRPGVGDVLRCQAALEHVDVETLEGQAALADALLTHLTGEHGERIADLRVEEQTQVVTELYDWMMGAPTEGEDDAPLGGSSASHGGPDPVLTRSSDGTPSGSSTSSVPLDPFSLPSGSETP